MTEVRITALTAFDAPRCAALEAELFATDSPWSVADFQAEIASPHTYYVGMRRGETLLAYAGIGQLGNDDPDFEVHTIGVDPAEQGQGLGRALLEHCLAQIDATVTTTGGNTFLEVRTDNVPALRLYESCGFQVIARRRNYYQPSGADAFVMQRARPVVVTSPSPEP